jgi:hypothetical protein
VTSAPLRQANDLRRLTAAGAEAINEYLRTERPELLDAAVSTFRDAVTATPLDHPDYPSMLLNLGFSLQIRFERGGDVGDLDEAIEVGRAAVAATPVDHPDRPEYLVRLRRSLSLRFEHGGDVGDRDEAIEVGRAAVTAIPVDHPDRPLNLSILGGSLSLRFEHGGDVADLDEAIDVLRAAVVATPVDHPEHAGYLSYLGDSLSKRFEHGGDVADLDAAINAGRAAVAATRADHPDRARFLSSLGISLQIRFERGGDVGDLDEAIEVGRAAVAATPVDHPDHAGYLSNLGRSLRMRFERGGDVGDLDEAIIAARQAVKATPLDHRFRVTMLSNLGASLRTRFERGGDAGDLDEAIEVGRAAVTATPVDLPDRPLNLSMLGTALLRRFERDGDVADLDAALGCWRHASGVETATPRVRLTAAHRWGAVAADADRRQDAVEGFEVAVGLLPAVAWHGLDRITREEQLAQWAGLASDAAACAVLDGRPGLAVELLEQGRSVLWNQSLNLRTDLTRLTAAAPDLAGRLESIRAVLDTPIPDTFATVDEPAGETVEGGAARSRAALDLRRRLAREWDQILARVRALNGEFEYFLAPTPYVELAAAVVDGPVVMVNTSRLGCHALIVDASSEQARVVDLPNLSLNTAIDRANEMLGALSGADDPARSFLERDRDRHAVLDILDWLWDVIAEPVLTALGHTAPPPPGDPWPRVWWCPTGPLSVLPIHAAGHHPRLRTTTSDVSGVGAAGVLSVLDRVVSSYTPTLTALARAREPRLPALLAQLTVAMPITPGLSSLPAVTDELGVLAHYFPPGGMNVQLVGSDATRGVVMDAIAIHPWVHLACHAGQQHVDASRSAFALWDGQLTIADLAARPAEQRDLAFLSACQTATGSVRHLDEAIHLAAAMQFLGYRHVIATMWTIADSPAPDVAGAVYTALTAGGTPDADQTARALHHAIHALRQTDPTNPILWAPYTHLGA